MPVDYLSISLQSILQSLFPDIKTVLISFIILIIPGTLWLIFFAGSKDLFKRPFKSILPVFGMGVFVSVPAIGIEYFCLVVGKLIETTSTVFITTFFIIAPVEEYLKSIAVDIGGYSRKEECKPRQILAWYVIAAIGFASIENTLYFLVFGFNIYIYRVLITTLAHIACSGLIGLFIASNPDHPSWGFFKGMVLSILIHGGYDFCLNVYPLSIWVWIPILLLIVCYIEAKLDPYQRRNSYTGDDKSDKKPQEEELIRNDINQPTIIKNE